MKTLWMHRVRRSAKWVIGLAVLCAASAWERVSVHMDSRVLPDMVLDQYPMFMYITPIFIVVLVPLLDVFEKSYVIVRYKNSREMGVALQAQLLLLSIAYAVSINLWLIIIVWFFNNLQSRYESYSVNFLQIPYLTLRLIFFSELALFCKKLLKKNVFVFMALYGMIAIEFILFIFGVSNRMYVTPGISTYGIRGSQSLMLEATIYTICSIVLALVSNLYTRRFDLYTGEWND